MYKLQFIIVFNLQVIRNTTRKVSFRVLPMRNINFQHPFAQTTCISLIHIYLHWANRFMQHLEKLRADSHPATTLSEMLRVFPKAREQSAFQ